MSRYSSYPMTSSTLSVGLILSVVTVLHCDSAFATGNGGIDDRAATTGGSDESRELDSSVGANHRPLTDGGSGGGKDIVVEFCQWETFNASCAASGRRDVVILVTAARYGRMKVGRCVPVEYFTGCSVDALPLIERRCSGRRDCQVVVSDRQLFRVHPCRKDLVAYLEVTYRCISVSGLSDVISDEDEVDEKRLPDRTGGSALPVPGKSTASTSDGSHSSASRSCADAKDSRLLTAPFGYIAIAPTSTSRRRVGLSQSSCPWLIRARPGQRITISAYHFGGPVGSQASSNFGLDEDGTSFGGGEPTSSGSGAFESCPVIAVFEEQTEVGGSGSGATETEETEVASVATGTRPSRTGSLRLCEIDQQRQSPVYTSSGNQLAIRFAARGNGNHGNETFGSTSTVAAAMPELRLFLQYEVVGCPDVAPPAEAWLVRNGDSMVVSCNFTLKRWHIVCNGRDWIGSFTNCTVPQPPILPAHEVVAGQSDNKPKPTNKRFSYGLLVAVAIGVVIGIAVGFTFLLMVCICKRRLRSGAKRKYMIARGAYIAGGTGNETDNDELYNKSLMSSSQMAAATSSMCDYTVVPQHPPTFAGSTGVSTMTSSFGGKRIRIADGSARGSNRAMYVASLDWPPTAAEMSLQENRSGYIHAQDEDMDEADRVPRWSTCDCQLLPVMPAQPSSLASQLSVSGFSTIPEVDSQPPPIWRHLINGAVDDDEHRRCTCTSGRCRQGNSRLLPADMMQYGHVIAVNDDYDENGGDVAENSRPLKATAKGEPTQS